MSFSPWLLLRQAMQRAAAQDQIRRMDADHRTVAEQLDVEHHRVARAGGMGLVMPTGLPLLWRCLGIRIIWKKPAIRPVAP
jgi:hypothetical protein